MITLIIKLQKEMFCVSLTLRTRIEKVTIK